jgi:hypothetical protein
VPPAATQDVAHNGDKQTSGPDGASSTPEGRRKATLDAIGAKLTSLRGRDRRAAVEDLVQFLRAQPGVAEAGISADACVWGRFDDGVNLIVFNNLAAPPPGAGRAAAPASPAGGFARPGMRPDAPDVEEYTDKVGGDPTELPSSDTALIAGDWFYPKSDFAINGEIAALLKSHGYKTFVFEPTVEALRSVAGPGIFLLHTHGGYITALDGTRHFNLLTSTPYSTEKDQEFKELGWSTGAEPQVTIGVFKMPVMLKEADGVITEKDVQYFAITSHWVRKQGWRFAENSLVFINGCESDSDFAAACLDAGAGLYAGWTRKTYAYDAVAAERYLLDRLLGANTKGERYRPEEPPQRPFDYRALMWDIYQRKSSIGIRPTVKEGQTQLAFSPGRGNPTFGLLAPSIRFLEVDEAERELILQGIFGADPRSRREECEVVVGEQAQSPGSPKVTGKSLRIKQWEATRIVCDLPEKGEGSAGDVQVRVRQHRSNVRQLTGWEGEIKYEADGPGDLAMQMLYHVRFRADVGTYRDTLGEEPRHRVVKISPIRGPESTYVRYRRTGQLDLDQGTPVATYFVAWLGDGMIEYPGSADKQQFMIFDGLYDTASGRLRLNVDAWDGSGMKRICFNRSPGEPVTERQIEPDLPRIEPFTREPWLEFKVDDSYNILGDKRIFWVPVIAIGPYIKPDLDIPTYWRWTTIKPIHPPRHDAAR